MIEFSTAATWLNLGESSFLTPDSQKFINSFTSHQPKKLDRDKDYDAIRERAKKAENILEQAEILVNFSILAYDSNDFDTVVRWLDMAAQHYEICQDIHRHGTVRWMLYLVHRAQGQYRLAIQNAKLACKLWSANADDFRQRKFVQKESWYRGRIIEMICEILSNPENTFELLNEFSITKLSPSAMDIRNRISTHLERKQTEKIDRDQQLLLGITLNSEDPKETAEAFGFCGVIAWVQENKNDAVNFFRSAMALYAPASYEYAVLQWMCGLVLINNPLDYSLSIQMLQGSIEQFDQLRMKAIHDNKIDRRDWFDLHILAMKRILRTLVESI